MPDHIRNRGGLSYSDFKKKGPWDKKSVHYQVKLTCVEFPKGIPYQKKGQTPWRPWAERALARLQDLIERGDYLKHKTVFDDLVPMLRETMGKKPGIYTETLVERIEQIIPTLLEFFGGTRVIDIVALPAGSEGKKSIVEYKEWREEKGITKSTLGQEFATLKKLIWEVDSKFKVPTQKDTERMRYKNPGGKIDRVLRPEEVDILLLKTPKRYRAPCRIAAATMLSANDIVGPKGFAPCHIQGRMFRKIRNKTEHKGGSLIQFKIGQEFSNILKTLPWPLDDHQPFFFDLDPDNMTSAVRKKFDRVPGYGWVTFRSFRDYGATLAHREGVPPKVIQKMMGQKDVRSIQPYIMTDDQDLEQAQEILDRASVCKRSASNEAGKGVLLVNR